ncbi:MAG: SRPBCC family protein [Pseudomonadota bacterium]
MDHATEVELAKELLALKAEKSAYLDDAVTRRPVTDYLDPERFRMEQERIFRIVPQPVLHASELPEPGSFAVREFAGLPVLFTRDADGVAHAFLNVCRHRGSRLVAEASGCKRRFSCPYHAWTYDNRGALVGVPHEKQGFPDLDRGVMSLRRVGCAERHGFIWAWADGEASPDIDASLAGLAPDLEQLDAQNHTVLHTELQVRRVNWKLLVEGGIEAYHFRVAHRDTIAPYFNDNLSTYRSFGAHMRSILSKRTMNDLGETPEAEWRLRDHAQVLYTIFPGSSFLVQADHIAWIQQEAISADTTRVRLSTLVPADRVETDADLAHWLRNHEITVTTLNEDFEIGEGIQAGLASGANTHLTFGRFEGALEVFNTAVDAHLGPA